MSRVTKSDNSELIKEARAFRDMSTVIANSMLRDWVGEERAREATGRIATALAASAASAKNPSDFYECTPSSVARVIAVSALTGIMVSTGQAALAYAVPRRPRKGEQLQLQYQLSHRGIAALAKRAGMSMVAYPISIRDEIHSDDAGEAIVDYRDIDNPPQSEDDLRGVLVIVRNCDGVIVARGFMPKCDINKRRDSSDSYRFAKRPGNEWAQESDPWHRWYVEMSIKTAMHYAIGRGWCVIDDTEAVRALQVDSESEYQQPTIEATAKKIEQAEPLASEETPAAESEVQA